MWKRFKRCAVRAYRKAMKEEKPIIIETPIPDLSAEGYIRPIIGIVVGHNKKRQGATNYLGESEFVFNSRIAKKLQMKLDELNIRSAVIFRPSSGGYGYECSSVAKQLRGMGASHALCLHFNSTKGAMGCEVLIANTHTKEDDEFADKVTDMLNEEYGFVERRDDGVFTVSSRHNGAGMLNAINRKGIVSALIEPCFADERTKESKLIFESEDKYVVVLARAIFATWKEKKIN
jgi:N-acetylmuramoyl-L-alanine amidase